MTTRNSNARFELAPQVGVERSTFDKSCNVKTSFNVGELIPFYVDEVLPGDTFEITTSKVARLQTLITPVMDNLYLDTYYFFVPNRLVWEHWEEFMGANKTSAWIPSVEYHVPGIYAPSGGWNAGTIADYMGIPIGVQCATESDTINALPFRAYALICDEWFRDETLEDPFVIPKNDTAVTGVNTGTFKTDCAKGGLPFVACKFRDYFTAALPSPQRGPDVTFLDGYVPVVTRTNTQAASTGNAPLLWREVNNSAYAAAFDVLGMKRKGATGDNQKIAETIALDDDGTMSEVSGKKYMPVNLFADLSQIKWSNDAVQYSGWNPLSINSLRLAFQIQRLFEKDARSGGGRYIEILKAHFGVTSPDARLQRPEYLGGNRVPFNIEQVLQTSSTDATTPQGNLAGWSQTNDTSNDVRKSFVEHGYIIGLMCARYDHSYQQGLHRMWQRYGRFDFYWPALAHIGEQRVCKSEIFFNGTVSLDVSAGNTFGYQEAWAEYRYTPNYITGQMRSTYTAPLDFWHFGDKYDSAPSLSASWIKEDKANVDRTLAVKSSTANQIFMDIFIKIKATRPMPLYSIPGLIDHF